MWTEKGRGELVLKVWVEVWKVGVECRGFECRLVLYLLWLTWLGVVKVEVAGLVEAVMLDELGLRMR
jgi:hypothetical protein